MPAIERTTADKWFSDCVRERVNWTCERCKKYYPSGPGRAGLHCSHHHSRGNWSIRFDPLCAECLCYGCHQKAGGTEQRRREVLTREENDRLWIMMHSVSIGRSMRKCQKEIAKHYKAEFERMKEKRNGGFMGRIEFQGFISPLLRIAE